MASNQSKTSPRKFSEKIALLNKKEAEGNAEFETIIKEVQATRSQSACAQAPACRAKDKLYNDKIDADDRAGLKEVYENLIKCVGQYEQDLHDSQQQQHLAKRGTDESQQCQPQVQHSYIIQQCEDGVRTKRSASAGLGLTYDDPAGSYSCVQPGDLSPARVGACNNNTDLNNNNIVHSQPKGNNPTWQAACGQSQNSTTCRARVTSFGSANERITCVNNCQQAKNPCEPNVSWNNSNQMFLNPTCDKSWQKSCSDPALHLVYTPVEGHHQPTTSILRPARDECQNNHINIQQQQQQQQQHHHQHQPVELEENIGPLSNSYLVEAPASIECDKSAYMIDFLMSEEQDNGNCKEGAQIFTQDGSLIAQIPQLNEALDVSSPASGPYSNGMNVLKDLPGINICAIDDDIRARVVVLDNDRAARNSSLPDIAHLRFNNADESYDTSEQVHVPVGNSIHQAEAHQLTWLQSAGSQPISFDERPELSSYVYASQVGVAQAGPLYAPRVNNLFSNSDCGLTNQGLVLNDELCNIIRSHSHNGINHMSKHQRHLHRHQAAPKNQVLDQHRPQAGKLQPLRASQPIKCVRRRASPSQSQAHQESMSSFEPPASSLSPPKVEDQRHHHHHHHHHHESSAEANPSADNNEYLTYSSNLSTQFANNLEAQPIREHDVRVIVAPGHSNNNNNNDCRQSLYAPASQESHQHHQYQQTDNQPQYPSSCVGGKCSPSGSQQLQQMALGLLASEETSACPIGHCRSSSGGIHN